MDGSRHGMDRSSHGMDRSCHVVGFQLEPSAREQLAREQQPDGMPDGAQGPEGRTTATPTTGAAASEGSHGQSSARPVSWLRLATDDPENQFHEIFTFEDDECKGPLKQDSSRLLILTSIEGGQHKQPPLFKRRHSTACNPTC